MKSPVDCHVFLDALTATDARADDTAVGGMGGGIQAIESTDITLEAETVQALEAETVQAVLFRYFKGSPDRQTRH